MEKKIETGLTLNGTKKFGNLLLEEAAKANKEKLSQRVIGTVAELLLQVEKQRKATRFLEEMIEALQAGAFNLSENGQIQFTDAKLNEDARWISYCGQCGYDKIVIAGVRGAR